jgi:hypothetical protein
MYVNQVRLRLKRAGRRKAIRLLVAFPILAAKDAFEWQFRRDPMGLNRARGRLRATPSGARLIWRSICSRHR